MCRPLSEGGRRCPGHSYTARRADYEASKVRASSDPTVHATALASHEPKLVAAGAEKIDTPREIFLQAGIGGYLTAHEPGVEGGDGFLTLRAKMQSTDPQTRYRALVELDRQGELTDIDRRWVEQHSDPHMRTAMYRGPDAAMQMAEIGDAEETEALAAELREAQEIADANRDELEQLRHEVWLEERARALTTQEEARIRRMHGEKGIQVWKAQIAQKHRERDTGVVLWVDADGEHMSGTPAERDAYLEAERQRADAMARGLASNPATPDDALQVLAVSPDYTTSARARGSLAARGVKAIWRRITAKRRRRRTVAHRPYGMQLPPLPPRERGGVYRGLGLPPAGARMPQVMHHSP